MMTISTMQDLLHMELMQTYGTERQVDEAIPGLLEHVTSGELRSDFEEMQATAKRQQQRLEQVFRLLGEDPKAAGATVAETMLDAIQGISTWKTEGMVRDAALIGAAQQYAHYLIASYGTLREHARSLGMKEAASLLQQCVDDEWQVDKMLTQRAEAQVNEQAARQPVEH